MLSCTYKGKRKKEMKHSNWTWETKPWGNIHVCRKLTRLKIWKEICIVVFRLLLRSEEEIEILTVFWESQERILEKVRNHRLDVKALSCPHQSVKVAPVLHHNVKSAPTLIPNDAAAPWQPRLICSLGDVCAFRFQRARPGFAGGCIVWRVYRFSTVADVYGKHGKRHDASQKQEIGGVRRTTH